MWATGAIGFWLWSPSGIGYALLGLRSLSLLEATWYRFHGSIGLARRGVVGAASQNRHDSNHEETGKGDPLWGLNSSVLVWPNHGGSEAISW